MQKDFQGFVSEAVLGPIHALLQALLPRVRYDGRLKDNGLLKSPGFSAEEYALIIWISLNVPIHFA